MKLGVYNAILHDRSLPEALDVIAGLGLSGMAERARLAGGELDVRSAPGGGTTVSLRIAQLQRVVS